ncbi:DUF4280 domain-containing protein [Chryseobacterium paludis]|uniref:DUF4280 domain-containing protein n=1 Tax=Chryseobacterium paludis TaxID=2956784 RepID=UPI0021BE22CD|nr:DUF4280 domain-containing protein [Chryseobacterium paludis]
MKNYVIRKGDTFSSLSKLFKIKNEGTLKTYHNLYCRQEDIMQEPIPGKSILIPQDPQFLLEESKRVKNNSPFLVNHMNSRYNDPGQEKTTLEKDEKKESSHESKYFIVQKGLVQCNQGFKFPKFKVTSHQKHYWNDSEGKADYLAVTEDDLQFDPSVQPFGQCKLKPTSGGYLPCTYIPSGKWQKTYEKVKIMGKSCLTEISELTCCTGGKISIFKHGQQSEVTNIQIGNAQCLEQQIYNPVVNFDEFKEEMEENEADAW